MTKQEKQIQEGKRLDDFINSLKINGKRFAKEVGVSQALVSSTVNGAKPITRIFVNKITTRYPDFRESWLFTGEGSMTTEDSVVEKYQIEESRPRTLEDVEADYTADPLAGLRDLIARVEELTDRVDTLDKWKAEWDARLTMSPNKDK